VEQPNLFGQCKRGSLNFNGNRIFTDASLQYTDPAVRKSRVSGSVTAYRRQSRFAVAGISSNINTGSSVRLGFPVPGSFFSTLGLTYTADVISLGNVDQSFVGLIGCTRNCFRSSLGADFTHDTRVDLPFASAGGLQSLTADFSGGPLGGTTAFQRYTGEARSFVTLGQFRGAGVGASVVTPLGPLGLDWAYGFDRRSLIDPARPLLGTRPDPRWQLHFRLGQVQF
jgi:outer membrane protein insertion porin family